MIDSDNSVVQRGLFPIEPKAFQKGAHPHRMIELVRMMDSGMLVRPLHQRGFNWSREKRRLYIDRLKKAVGGGDTLPGSVESYQIVRHEIVNGELLTHGGTYYLNDGLQRIKTATEYYKNPELYGDTADVAEAVLFAAVYTVHHRYYKNHEEAVLDFWLVNYGLRPSPYEQCHGLIAYMGDGVHEQNEWSLFFDDLHRVVSKNAYVVVGKAHETASIKKAHAWFRDDMGLFYRFLSGDTDSNDYRVSAGQIKVGDMLTGRVIESRLRIKLEEIGIAEAKKQLGVFSDLVARETALLLDVMRDTGRHGRTVSVVFYRWLLAASIWKRHNSRKSAINNDVWEDFIRKLLSNTDGKSTVTEFVDGVASRHPLGLNRIDSIGRVCRAIDSDMYDLSGKKRRTGSNGLQPGFDLSHVSPFSPNGEGPTFPEPASRNRSRGSSPVRRD